jgi:hypothetical protein
MSDEESMLGLTPSDKINTPSEEPKIKVIDVTAPLNTKVNQFSNYLYKNRIGLAVSILPIVIVGTVFMILMRDNGTVAGASTTKDATPTPKIHKSGDVEIQWPTRKPLPPSPSVTPTPTKTPTPTPPPTSTPAPTNTPSPTPTSTPVPAPTAANTPTPTLTPTITPTPNVPGPRGTWSTGTCNTSHSYTYPSSGKIIYSITSGSVNVNIDKDGSNIYTQAITGDGEIPISSSGNYNLTLTCDQGTPYSTFTQYY